MLMGQLHVLKFSVPIIAYVCPQKCIIYERKIVRKTPARFDRLKINIRRNKTVQFE